MTVRTDIFDRSSEAESAPVAADPGDRGVGAEIGAGSVSASVDHIAEALRHLAWPVDDLQVDPTNAKIHGDDSVNAIAESYRRHGQLKPLIARRQDRGRHNVVRAGSGGLLAARRLGLPTVAVLWLPDSLSDDAVRDFAYRDNLSAEPARWNEARLRIDADSGLDLLDLGFDAALLSDLLGADAPVPRFEPETPQHRLDELAAHCATCVCRQGGE